jgi:hypothetical protein
MSETRAVIADTALEDEDILLTDAEREAMKDDDDTDSGGDDGDADDGTDAAADQQPAAAAQEPAEPAQAASEAPAVPLIRAEDTTAATARLAAIDTEAENLSTRFDDGDMTAKEYAAALQKLETERRDLDWSVRKASLAAEVAEQQATQAWFSTVSEFLAEHPEINPENKLVYASFDLAVRSVTGDEANAALTGRQKLAKAYEAWSTAFSIKPAGKPAPAAQERPAAPARRPMPPSLANLPAADVTSVEDGKYAALDRLADTNPLAFEAAMERMSDAERDAYMLVS